MYGEDIYKSMSDSKVLSNLLVLESHDKQIYEFYSLLSHLSIYEPNNAFRCNSLFKWYQLEENDMYSKAL